MTCGENTDCFDEDGHIPGICRCLAGYVSDSETVTTEMDCKGENQLFIPKLLILWFIVLKINT